MRDAILHIEDDPSLAELFKTAFLGFGFKGEMLPAGCVHEAFTMLDEYARLKRRLAQVLSDMQLPNGE